MEVLNQNGISYITGATAADTGLGSYHPGSKFFCANGLKVTISERTDSEGGFTASWNYNGIDYSENFSADVTVIGGSWDGEVASAEIVMTGGTVNDIYGGGVTAASSVTGNVSIEIYDGKINHLTGGGAAGKVGGNVNIVIGDDEKGPYIEPNIIGGGFVEGADVAGDVTLTIKNGQVGPVPGPDGYPCQLIAGGGVFADVAGKVTVNVEGGEIYAIVAGGSMISGNVGSSVVNVSGGTVTQINGAGIDYFANGEIGEVGKVEINVSGGTILDAVVGGSVYRGEVTESVDINITGGAIGTLGGKNAVIAGSQNSDITGTTSVKIDMTGDNPPQITGAIKDADNFLLNGAEVDMSKIYVGADVKTDLTQGIIVGVNAFADVNSAAAVAETAAGKLVIMEGSDVTYTANQWYLLNTPAKEIETDKWSYDVVVDASATYDLQIDGTLSAYQLLLNNAETVVSESGKLFASGETLRVMGGTFTVEGNREAGAGAPDEIFTGSWGVGTKPGADTQIKAGYIQFNQAAAAEFNNTVVFVNAGWMNFDNATAEFNNTYIYLGSGGSYAPIAVQIANGAEVTFADNTTVINDKTFTMNITVDATSTLTMDASSSITATTLAVADGGKFIIDATNFYGVKKIVDIAGSESLEGKVTINGEGVSAVYGADGDVTLVKVDMSTIYVNAAFSGEWGTDLGDGKFMGINAFATTQEAYKAARNIGGEITIDLTGAGAESLGGTIGFGNAGNNGYYTITGGSVNTTSYGIYINNPMDITVKFDNAMFKLAKLYVESAKGELIVNNSVIGTAAYSGHGSGWVTALQGDIKISDSIFGMNFANYTEDEIKAMPRSASDVKAAVAAGTYKYWAFGSNNSGPHMGTTDEISVTDSTLSATWISLIDRAEMNLNNSVLYYGAAISIGAGQVDGSLGKYDSNEIGWDAQIWWGSSPAASKDGFREGEVATMNITDSIVRNIGSGNGNAGAHVQVGGSVTYGNTPVVGQDFAGVLNLKNSEFHITPYDAEGNAIAREYDFLAVKGNGTVNMDNSTLVTAKVINDGEFYIKGEETSTLNIGTFTGNAIEVVGGGLKDSNVGGANVLVTGDAVITGEGTFGNVKVNNGAELVFDENAQIVSPGTFIGAGNDADYYPGLADTNAENAAGKVTVAGSVSVQQVNANASGEVVVADGGVLTTEIICVENGGIEDAAAGSLTVEIGGEIYTQRFNVFAGATVTVKGYVSSEQAFTSDNKLANVISVWDGGTLTIDGGEFSAAHTVHTEGRLSGVNIGSADAKLNIVNGGLFNIGGVITNAGTITVNGDSNLIAQSIAGTGTITVNAAGFTGVNRVLDLSIDESMEGKVQFINRAENVRIFYGTDGDVVLSDIDTDVIYINAEYNGDLGDKVAEGKYFGINAFNKFDVALMYGITDETSIVRVESDVTVDDVFAENYILPANLLITADKDVTIDFKNTVFNPMSSQGKTIVFEHNVHLKNVNQMIAWDSQVVLNGNFSGDKLWTISTGNAKLTINETSKVKVAGQLEFQGGVVTINGVIADTEVALGDSDKIQLNSTGSGTWNSDTKVYLNNTYVRLAQVVMNSDTAMDNSILEIADRGSFNAGGSLKLANDSILYIGNAAASNSGTMEFQNSSFITEAAFSNSGTMEFNGSKFAAEGAVNNSGKILVSGEETSELDFTFDSDSTFKLVNVLGGGLKDSEFNGDVLVTGDAAFEGENSFGNIKVTNGAELVINDTLTGAETFIGAGNDNYYGMENGETASGSVIINGNVDVYQINANNGGYVQVAEDASVNTAIIAVENGSMADGTAGKLDVDGTVQSTFLNVFNGGEVNIGDTGYVQLGEHESDQTLLKLGADSTVNVEGELNIQGSGTVEGTLSVDNAVLTVSKTLTIVNDKDNGVVGSVYVTGESTVNIKELKGSYVKFENASIVNDSNIGGDIRAYENFDVYGNFTVKQSNLYGTTVVHDGAVYTGSTTIVGTGGNFTLENGGTINSRFFNVVGGTADIYGDIALTHSDPRQKLLQIHEDGVLNLEEGGNIVITRHNALVKADGTLNVNGGSLVATPDTVNVAADRGGVLYNSGTVNVNAGLVDIKNLNNETEDSAVNINGGVVSVSDTFTNAGSVEINDADLTVGVDFSNKGNVVVSGSSVLDINKVTGNAIKIKDAVISDSVVGTKVFDTEGSITSVISGTAISNVYGNVTFTGTNFFDRVDVGRDSSFDKATVLTITGDFWTNNMLTGTVHPDNKVYIGQADVETNAYFGQIGGFGAIDINNANVDYHYAFIRNAFTVKDSTLNCTSINTYLAGQAVAVVDNSTWNIGSNVTIGSYGGSYMAGNADVTLQNGSVMNVGKLEIYEAEGKTVKLEVIGEESVLNSTDKVTIGAGAEVSVLSGGAINANKIDLKGTINIDGFSTITVNGLDGFTYGDSALISVDATDLVGVWKILDLNNSESLNEDLFKFANGNEYFQVKYLEDGDVIISNADTSTVFVDENWADKKLMDDLGDGKYFGFNAFSHIADAIREAALNDKIGTITVAEGTSAVLYTFAVNEEIVTNNPNGLIVNMGNNGVSFDIYGNTTLNGEVVADDYEGPGSAVYGGITIAENVKVYADQLAVDPYKTANIKGELDINGAYIFGGKVEISGVMTVRDQIVLEGGYGTGADLNIGEGGVLNAKKVYAFNDDTNRSSRMVIDGTANVENLEFGGTVTLNATGSLNSSTVAVNHFINNGTIDFANTHVSIAKLDNNGSFTVSGNLVALDVTNNAAESKIIVSGGELSLNSMLENFGSFAVSGGKVTGDAFLLNKGTMEITGGEFLASNLNNSKDGSFVATGDSVMEIDELTNSGEFILKDNVSLTLGSVRNNTTVTLEDFQGNLEGFVKSDVDVASGIIQVYGDTVLSNEVGTSDLYIGEKAREEADSLTVAESAVINASNLYVKKSGSLTIEKDGEVNVIGHYNGVDGIFVNYGKTDVSGTLNITNDGSCGENTIGGVLDVKDGGNVNLNTTKDKSSAKLEILTGAELNVEEGGLFYSDGKSKVYNHGTVNVYGNVDLGYTAGSGDRAENSFINDGTLNIFGGEMSDAEGVFAAEEVVNADDGLTHGTINIDSTGVLKAGIVSNGTKDSKQATINLVAGGLIIADEFVNHGKFNITVEDDGVWLVVDAAAGTKDFGVIKVNGVVRDEDLLFNDVANGDLYLVNTDKDALYFNSAWAPSLAEQLGANTFTDTTLNGKAVEIKDGVNAVKFYAGSYSDYTIGKDVALETMNEDIADVNLTADANVTIANGVKGEGTRFTATENSSFTVTENGSLTVEDKSEFAVGSIVNAGKVTVDGAASAAMSNSGEFVVNGKYTGTIENSGDFVINGSVTGNIENSGEVVVNGKYTGDVNNSGDFVINGSVTGNVDNSGTLTLNAANTFGNFANSNAVNLGVNGVFVVQGDFVNDGVFTVNIANNLTGAKRVIDLNDEAEYTWSEGSIKFNGFVDGMQIFFGKDGDVAVVGSDVKMNNYVFNNAWSSYELADAIVGMKGFYYGINAFANTSEITAQHWGETPEKLTFYTGSYDNLTLNLDLEVETLPLKAAGNNKIEIDQLTTNNSLTVKAGTIFAMSGELVLNSENAMLTVENGAYADFGSITLSDNAVAWSSVDGNLNVAGDMQARNMEVTANGSVKVGGTVEVLDNTEFNVFGKLNANAAVIGNDDIEDGFATVNIGGVNAEVALKDMALNADAELNVFDTASFTCNGVITNNGVINVSNAFFNGDAYIYNNGKIYITGASEFSATVTGNGNLRMADGATLDGDLKADMLFVEHNGYFAENANFAGKLNGNYMYVGGSNNTLDITVGSNATLVIEDGTVFQSGDDTLGDIDLKGVETGTVLVAADSVFEGNKLEDIKLELTDADNRVNVDIELENIISINGYMLESMNGIYYYIDEYENQMFVTRDEVEGKYVISIADGSQPNAATVEEVKNVKITQTSSELANINLKMATGKTTITVANGKANNRIEFAAGSILKDSKGGTNIIKIGNYNDVSINGIITHFGGMTIGNKSNVTIGAKDDNGDFIANTGNITAQNNSEAIKIGSDSTVTFAGSINLPGGKNSVSVGARSELEILGNVSGMTNFTVAAGKKAKADGTGEDYTVVSINGDYIAADMNNKLTIGNYASFTLGTADNGKGNISNGGVESNTGTTIKVGTASKMTVYGDADGVAGLTTGKDSFVVFGTANREGGNITGTAKNNKISVGANATFKAYDIDLAGGKNTITTAKGENTVFKAGNISNVQTVNVGALSSFTADSITGVNKFTVNNGKAATKKAEAVMTEAVIKGDVLMTGGKDTFKVGSNSEVKVLGNNDRNSEDKIFGEINFGAGKDTLTMGKDSKLFVGDIKGLEVFNASKGATIEIANGADNDVYLDDVTGSWDKATIIDYEGELGAGFFSGSVYANETDAYELNVADGKKFELLCDNEDVVITYAEFDDNGVLGEFKLYEAGMELTEGHYGINVAVAGDYEDKVEKKGYDFIAKLA